MIRLQAEMSAGPNGSFSYKNERINGFNVTINGQAMQIRVERVNNNIASISVTDVNGNPQPVPPAMTLVDGTNTTVPPRNNEFLITWIDSYTLKVAGVDTLWLHNQKQQSFRGVAGVTHFVIDI